MNSEDTITLTAVLGGFAAALNAKGVLSSDDIFAAADGWERSSAQADDPKPIIAAVNILKHIAESMTVSEQAKRDPSGILEAELSGRLHAIEAVLQEVAALSLTARGMTVEQVREVGSLSLAHEEQKTVRGSPSPERKYSVMQRMIHHLERLWHAIASDVETRTPPPRFDL